jgi:hypothetical protein
VGSSDSPQRRRNLRNWRGLGRRRPTRFEPSPTSSTSLPGRTSGAFGSIRFLPSGERHKHPIGTSLSSCADIAVFIQPGQRRRSISRIARGASPMRSTQSSPRKARSFSRVCGSILRQIRPPHNNASGQVLDPGALRGKEQHRSGPLTQRWSRRDVFSPPAATASDPKTLGRGIVSRGR